LVEEKGWKKGIQRMMRKRREFPKEEFLDFGYV